MNILGHNIGVCSWSLRASDTSDLIEKIKRLELTHVQLALGDLLSLGEVESAAAIDRLRPHGISIVAGMISFPGEDYSSIQTIKMTGGLVPDDKWEARWNLALAAAKLAARTGIPAVSTHIGFVPMGNDANYSTVVDRLRSLAGAMMEQKIDLLMETGQESSSELLQFLNNLSCKNVGVNFDPANMILYGSGDPIEAIRTLGRHIRHVHVKDAVASKRPGLEWGSEVAFGDGEVPHARFIQSLHSVGYAGALTIEREAGNDRMGDVAYAIETLQGI